MTGPKYLVTQAFARAEGYGEPGALPTRDNNPLDLRHSPHSMHDAAAPDAIGRIDCAANGWADADRQMELWAERGMNLGDAIDTQLGIRRVAGMIVENPDRNNYAAYVRVVLDTLLTCTLTTPMTEVLRIPAV